MRSPIFSPTRPWPRIATIGALTAFAGTAPLALGDLTGVIQVDGLAAALSLLTFFITAVVLGFSERHLRADRHSTIFAVNVAGLAASIVTMFWATHLAVFALAWVVSGRFLAALVGHLRGWDEAEFAARRCKRSFLIADLALVAGFAVIGIGAGSLQMHAALAAIPELPTSLKIIASLLLLTAACARCALPPFSGWLLGSMSAPTPVSALMHGGFVNAGGFLLIRFAPLFTSNSVGQAVAIAVGCAAALYGIAIMLVRPDVKGALAGSTISQMGFMIMTCGLGAFAAALWHLVAHGLFKAALFLGAGSAVGMTASRSIAPTTGQAAAIATVTLIAGGFLAAVAPSEALVPLLLALATGLAAIVVAGRKAAPLLPPAALLLALSLVGAATASKLVDQHEHPPASFWQLGLVALLLAGWIAQLIVARRGLPPRAYVHLLNAGAIHAR